MEDVDKAFEVFVRAGSAALVRYGFVLTGSWHDAADLAQEALARPGSAWSRVQRKDDPDGYARTTMARLHISRWRRRCRELLVGDPPDRGVGAAMAGRSGDDPGARSAGDRIAGA